MNKGISEHTSQAIMCVGRNMISKFIRYFIVVLVLISGSPTLIRGLRIILYNSELIEGSNITLYCKIPDFQHHTSVAIWSKGKVDLTECPPSITECSTKQGLNGKYSFRKDESGLYFTITHLDKSDISDYSCRFWTKSAEFSITKDNLLVPLKICHLKENEEAFICQTQCQQNPEISFSWILNGKEIIINRNATKVPENCTDVLHKSKLSNEGNVSCTCGIPNKPKYDIASNVILYKGTGETQETSKHLIIGVSITLVFVVVIGIVALIYFVGKRRRRRRSRTPNRNCAEEGTRERQMLNGEVPRE